MEHLWAFLYQTLTLSVVGGVLLIAKALFLDKLSPRWQYGVWVIFALRALLPAGLLNRESLPGLALGLEVCKTLAEGGLSSVLTDPYGATVVKAPVPLVRLAMPGSVTDLLFYLYVMGVAVCLGWFFLSYLRLRRGVRLEGVPAGAEALAQVERLAGQYNLKCPRRVVVVPGVNSAFVCGPLAPVLVLPEGEVDDKVLLHELLHLRHGDLWAGVGMCLLRCLHWCNPFVWYCCDRMGNDCEALCDQRVLERLEGEARREYGVILLSMAGGRYARAPGTTSMANGARNIKARIAAIARFKRYPQGVELASRCVAAALALTCLVGSGQAAAQVPEGDEYGLLAVTQARLNRPTTPAGALDTYAKALLCDNPIYYAMACPQLGSWQDGLTPRQAGDEDALENSPFEQAGFHRWSRPAWQAIWHVYSFLPDGAGGYTGLLLFIDATEPSLGLGQQVAVRPDGAYWTVTPLTDLTRWPVAEGEDSLFFFPNATLPYTTYTAQVDGLTVEVDFQCLLGVDNTIVLSTGGFFGGTDSKQDPLPRPSTPFTHLRTSSSARLTRTDTGAALGERVELTCAVLEGRALEQQDPQAALKGGGFDFTIELGPDGEELSQSGGGIYDGEGVSLSCAPAALAFSFTYEGQEYTGIAWPEEDLS